MALKNLKRPKIKELRQNTESNNQETESEIAQADTSEPMQQKTIIAAPAIKEAGEQEKELGALIDQLRKLNRHWGIERAKRRGVPIKALIHAANLWLSDDQNDWTAANDTIFQFTSRFGDRQLHFRRSEKVAIPNI